MATRRRVKPERARALTATKARRREPERFSPPVFIMLLVSTALVLVEQIYALLVRGAPAPAMFLLGYGGVLAVMSLLAARIVVAIAPQMAKRGRLGLAGGLFVGTLVTARVFAAFDVSIHATPVVVAGVLFAQVMPTVGAVSACAILAPVLALHEPSAAPALFAAAATAAYAARRIDTRTRVLQAGIAGGLVQATVVLFIAATGGLYTLGAITTVAGQMGWAAAAGVVWALVLSGAQPLLERHLGMVTPMRLDELADLNQPIFRRFLLEAPGTYHHSVLVGSLAEAAAEAVSADGLLARVGAYFHDIGKLSKPTYFTENVRAEGSRHERLSPAMSALVIMSHVKDGVELAGDLRLPRPIVEIIEQHHGTSVVEYFYHEALEEARRNGNERSVDITRYRYPGPRPRSREAAIVMLADAVEAASRSLKEPSSTRVAELVHELVMNRLLDGQLDESPLTLREIHIIEATLTHMLQGIFHTRISYPSRKGGGEAAEEEAPRGSGADS